MRNPPPTPEPARWLGARPEWWIEGDILRTLDSGAPLTGTADTFGQLAILLGTTATAATLVRNTDGLISCAAACGWGYGGAALGTYQAGAYLLAAAGAPGLMVVLVGFGAEQLCRQRVAEAWDWGPAPSGPFPRRSDAVRRVAQVAQAAAR